MNINQGEWRFSLDLNGAILPFNAVIENADNGNTVIRIRNAEEEILVDEILLGNDSLIADLPVFNTEILARIESPSMISGFYVDHNRDSYKIPLTAEHDRNFRFTNTESSIVIRDRYKVIFTESDDSHYPAILKLENTNGKIHGTFMTETGDYRHLQGNIMNSSVYLSTFDGTHVFYFRARIQGDSLVDGVFLSGTHYSSSWVGAANDTFQLADPVEITSVTGDSTFNFSLPDQNGNQVNWDDLDLNGKVVIMDIMGTWCPNCMDAGITLSQLAEKHNNVVVLPVLFEKKDDLNWARRAYEKFSQDIEMPERFLFGGRASKSNAASKFPMLSDITSFPTLVFIDKKRKIRSIYTGFYGPATGEPYKAFKQSTDSLLNVLASETP